MCLRQHSLKFFVFLKEQHVKIGGRVHPHAAAVAVASPLGRAHAYAKSPN
jgi:hypothetical protein